MAAMGVATIITMVVMMNMLVAYGLLPPEKRPGIPDYVTWFYSGIIQTPGKRLVLWCGNVQSPKVGLHR